jgi:uncharacterized protein YndB with AHSA1/START domain
MKSKSIKFSVTIPATPQEVFRALTDERLIARWCGQRGKVEPRVGGKIEMFDGWVKGKVKTYEPGESLAYTWLPGDWPVDAEESLVTYSLSGSVSGTTVKLTHSHFPNPTEVKNHEKGWTEYVFDPLKKYFSSRK